MLDSEIIRWGLAVWLFAFGGVIGSFLNVVVYRLPAGMSLSKPGSHCPICKTAIRWYHNIPILGWIVLHGRCYDCKTRIPMRYPAVETTLASMFAVLGWCELLSGGANLPPRVIPSGETFLLMAWSPGESVIIFAYHAWLLSTLLAGGLIEFDGHRVPVRLFVPAVVVGLALPLAFPYVHPVGLVETGLSGWALGVADGLLGLVVGLGIGLIAGLTVGSLSSPREAWGIAFGLACTGIFLGWQAALLLATFAMGCSLLAQAACRLHSGADRIRRVSPLGWLTPAVMAWILTWNHSAGTLITSH